MAPTLILACGACTDALVDTKFWWLALMAFLLLGLLTEGAVFTVVTWLRRIDSVAPRAFPAAAAGGLFTLGLFSYGATVGITVAALILLPAACWSLFRNHRFSPLLTWIRVTLIVVGAAVGVWRAWPSHRPVEQLVETGLSVTRFRVTDGWLFEELRSRPDAVPVLELRASSGNIDDGDLLRLHAALGGSSSFREKICVRVKAAPPYRQASFAELCPR